MSWERKAIRVDGRRAELLMDLRFEKRAPVAELPELHWVAVWCRTSAGRDRFIPVEEEPVLLRFEERLLGAARRISNGWAVHAMRVVSQGRVEYLFYGRDAAILSGLATELSKAFPDYRIEQESRPDPQWIEYLRHLPPGG